MFSDTDAATYYYPAFQFYGEALRSGQSFLWNPYIFSGFPTYLSQSAGFFDPINLILFRFLDTLDAYHLRILIDLALVIFVSYGAARALGLSRAASFMVGPAYLVAFNWWYITNPVIANSLYLVPLLLWAGTRIIERHRTLLWTLLCGLGVGWSLLSGYAQFTVYAVMICGAYLLGDMLWVRRRDFLDTTKTLAYFVGALVIGALVALPQILPALEFVPHTVRAEGLSYAVSIFKVIQPGDFILLFFPDYLYFPYISGGRRPLFVGALICMLAIFAIVALIWNVLRRAVLEDQQKRMLLGAGALTFCLVAALAHSPLYYLMQQLPVLSYFRFPYRWMYVGAWFLALLGAWGFDYARTRVSNGLLRSLSRMYALGVSAVVGVAIMLQLMSDAMREKVSDGLHALLGMFAYGRFGLGKDPTHYRDAIERGIAAWQDALSLADLSFALPLLILALSAALLYLYARRHIGERLFVQSAVALPVATFLLVFVVQWSTAVPSTLRQSHESMLSSFMSGEELRDYRTFPFMLGESLTAYIPPQYTLSEDEMRATATLQLWSGGPNTNTYALVGSADGYDPFVPSRLLRPLQSIGSTHAGEEVTRTLTTEEKKARLLGSLPLLGQMSVKYVISGIPLEHSGLTLVHTESVLPYGAKLYVYKNAYAMPRVRFATDIESRPGTSLSQLMEANAPFGVRTHLDCGACERHTARLGDVLKVETQAHGYFRIHTRTTGSRWLVIGESYLPGWRILLDGEPVTSYLAEGLYMAVEVPQGEHTVVAEYEGVLNELEWLKRFGLVAS